mmetsp:Transcript_6484/g.10307  ORF Transcript_6484/g.10307 Transcript_6484/m.10307 type:complete len:220 (-) Transcript_6484:428-1087(-)
MNHRIITDGVRRDTIVEHPIQPFLCESFFTSASPCMDHSRIADDICLDSSAQHLLEPTFASFCIISLRTSIENRIVSAQGGLDSMRIHTAKPLLCTFVVTLLCTCTYDKVVGHRIRLADPLRFRLALEFEQKSTSFRNIALSSCNIDRLVPTRNCSSVTCGSSISIRTTSMLAASAGCFKMLVQRGALAKICFGGVLLGSAGELSKDQGSENNAKNDVQ